MKLHMTTAHSYTPYKIDLSYGAYNVDVEVEGLVIFIYLFIILFEHITRRL